jgi:hypothetical protein
MPKSAPSSPTFYAAAISANGAIPICENLRLVTACVGLFSHVDVWFYKSEQIIFEERSARQQT